MAARPRGRSTGRAVPEGTARSAGIPNASRKCLPDTRSASDRSETLRRRTLLVPMSPPVPFEPLGRDAGSRCDLFPSPLRRKGPRGGLHEVGCARGTTVNCGTRGDRSPPSRHAPPGWCCHLPSRPAASDVRSSTSHRPPSRVPGPGFDPKSVHLLQASLHARMPKHPRGLPSFALFHKPRRRASRAPPVSPPWEPPPAHEEPACTTVAGAPKDPTTTARGLRPHRCGRGDLPGSGDESPSPKARSRRAGEACFAIRGTRAPRGAIAAASFRPAKRRWATPEGTSRESPSLGRGTRCARLRNCIRRLPNAVLPRRWCSPSISSRFFSPRGSLPGPWAFLRSSSASAVARFGFGRPSVSVVAFRGIPPGPSNPPRALLRPSTVARLRPSRGLWLIFGSSVVSPPGPRDRPSMIVSSRAHVGPSTHPVPVSPPGRAQRASRRRSVDSKHLRSSSTTPPLRRPKPSSVGYLRRH